MKFEEIIVVTVMGGLIIYLWFFLFREYFIAAFRHQLFVLRGELFDFAQKNNISFDNPVFLIKWNEINNMIRFAHESHLMFVTAIFTSHKRRLQIGEFLAHKEEQMRILPEQQQKFISNIENRQFKIFISYLIKSSIVLLSFTIVIGVLVFVVSIFKWLIDQTNILRPLKSTINGFYDDYSSFALDIH